jgi:hypothetical protein
MTISGSKYNRAIGEFAILASSGTVTGPMDFGRDGHWLIGCRSKGTPAAGVWPRLRVLLDRKELGHITINSDQPSTYAVLAQAPAGKHDLAFSFVNDAQIGKEDRNVYLSHFYIQPVDEPGDDFQSHAQPAALATIPVGKGSILVDTIKWDEPGEHAQPARAFVASLLVKLGAYPRDFALAAMEAEHMKIEEVAHNKASAIETCLANQGSLWAPIVADRAGDYELRIHGRGKQALGEWPILIVKLGGKEIGKVTLRSSSTVPFSLPVALTAGEHDLEMRFINDYYEPGKEDRNAYIDKVEIWEAP